MRRTRGDKDLGVVILCNRYWHDGSHRTTLSSACRIKLICSCRDGYNLVKNQITWYYRTLCKTLHIRGSSCGGTRSDESKCIKNLYTYNMNKSDIFFSSVIFTNIGHITGFYHNLFFRWDICAIQNVWIKYFFLIFATSNSLKK